MTAIPALPMPTVDPHEPRQVVFSGYTVLVTRHDGGLRGGRREGLYHLDTRILSLHRLTIGGIEPDWVSGGIVESDVWTATLVAPRAGGTPEGPVLPQDRIELQIQRRLGGGMTEDWTVRSHSMASLDTELVVELDTDFADVQESEGDRGHDGNTEVAWDELARCLRFVYRAQHGKRKLRRGLEVRIEPAEVEVVRDGRSLRFSVRVPPRGEWRARLTFGPGAGNVAGPSVPADPPGYEERNRLREEWRRDRPRLEASNAVLAGAWNRAAEDLWALRNWELDPESDAWVPNAGVPTYTGFFGRDSLTAGWQAALLGPEMMRGALSIAHRSQAREDSAWRDEEPGKMVHEMRLGPLSELELIPQRAYYGTVTSSAMFVLALSELWHWTGDPEPLRRYRDAALRTFEWAARYGDRDGDGFIEYERRSSKGLKNHAWKDSDEAIRYPDGSIVPNPIATCEEQAYHIIALQRMAEILTALEEDDSASELLRRARELGRRWHDAFWLEDAGYYAMALDPRKRRVRSIGSNAGHALAAGIVPPEHARRVADRMMAPDLFSGWGIRTLSTEHTSYNPWAYHLGTVWPVENATFALGFKRYGLDDHLERLVEGLFAAAGHFRELRLPEALVGHPRSEGEPPAAYPGSNSPQAWSASAVVQLVQVILGLYPFAHGNLLALVRPKLPRSVDELTIRGVRVGDARISIRFRREENGGVTHDVIERNGKLTVITVPPPNADGSQETAVERIKEFILEHAPGRAARALRIAIGDTGD